MAEIEEEKHSLYCTDFYIWSSTTVLLAQKSRKVSVVFSRWFWHVSQGDCTTFNTPVLSCDCWHEFQGIRTTRRRHKKRGANLYFVAENSGKNFEEFCSFPV
jgi:hypothetical protein